MRKFLGVVAKSIAALLLAATLILAVFLGLLVWHFEYGLGLPDREQLLATSGGERICSAGGNRTFVPLAEIPPLLRSAILAYEDPDFYKRPSMNLLMEPVRSVLFNRTALKSTISATVARCFMPSLPISQFDWNIGRVVVMDRVERTLSKDRILEIYMNDLYFGRGAYGVTAAASAHFNKTLSELTIDQAAFIAALARTPYVSRSKDRGTERRNVVIDKMLKAGVISEAQAHSAEERPLALLDQAPDGQTR
jgi:membrane carboxypeptidase/penicillin-binding protein